MLNLTADEEEEESEEESDADEVAESVAADGLQTPSGLETPSGMTSVVSTVAGGLETPDFLELRKAAPRASSEIVDSAPRSLYQVVPEKQTSVRGLMGSDRAYDVGAVATSSVPVLGDERGSKVSFLFLTSLLSRFDVCLQRKSHGVEVSLDESELESISTDDLRRKYAANARGNAGVPGKGEDFSDMVAKEMAKKKQKMDRDTKKKDYKF